MISGLRLVKSFLAGAGPGCRWRQAVSGFLRLLVVAAICLLLVLAQPAQAGINDDKFDGNIFVLYAGNGSLVPPKVTLAESLKQSKPAIVTFYLDDSSDCKQFASLVSRLQAFYGRAANIIPVNVDAIAPKSSYDRTEPGYYYEGAVPQTAIIDQSGNVVFNAKGQVPYEEIDDVLRKVFDLLPRSESVELKRRSFNEFNSELSK
ncbi:thylakoid membrane photosystem I accumulation factor [Kamptonema formosum]|uniref:thylakoid membrane photosystem I accumulation factor n=1 Tax=Kamptonema formosum TaxID=331992 RepID=UPI0003643E2C